MKKILAVRDLHLAMRTGEKLVPVLRGINLNLPQGEVHGLVGESGAGKTMLGRVILDILPPNAVVTAGHVDCATTGSPIKSGGRIVSNRGRSGISLIPQDPMTSLNPVKKIGKQMVEILKLAHTGPPRALQERAEALLAEVRIKNPKEVLKQYPHHLSGGMRQRVLIAMAFSSEPGIIIADEPTTALDVSVQRRVLRLIRDLQKERNTTILFVTHDLGVVAKLCDKVSLMHSGMILEQGLVSEVFHSPSHPYTRSLLRAIEASSEARTESWSTTVWYAVMTANKDCSMSKSSSPALCSVRSSRRRLLANMPMPSNSVQLNCPPMLTDSDSSRSWMNEVGFSLWSATADDVVTEAPICGRAPAAPQASLTDALSVRNRANWMP